MPRRPRDCTPDSVQHIISRFVDRRYLLRDQQDRRNYLQCIDKIAVIHDWKHVSFALMSSHIHHGFIAGTAPLNTLMHPLHTRYAIWWHKRHGGLGPVFAGRPTSYELPDTDIPRLIAYHHRNPVDAGVVDSAADSRWTSHRFYLRLEKTPQWLDVELGLHLCGMADTAAGRCHFDQFVNDIDFSDFNMGNHSGVTRDALTTVINTTSLDYPYVNWSALVQTVRDIASNSPRDIDLRVLRCNLERVLLIRVAISLGFTRAEIGRKLGIGRSAVSMKLQRTEKYMGLLAPHVKLAINRMRCEQM